MVPGDWAPAAGGLLREAFRGAGAEAIRQLFAQEANAQRHLRQLPSLAGLPGLSLAGAGGAGEVPRAAHLPGSLRGGGGGAG